LFKAMPIIVSIII